MDSLLFDCPLVSDGGRLSVDYCVANIGICIAHGHVILAMRELVDSRAQEHRSRAEAYMAILVDDALPAEDARTLAAYVRLVDDIEGLVESASVGEVA
jgi:hypothetical protein